MLGPLVANSIVIIVWILVAKIDTVLLGSSSRKHGITFYGPIPVTVCALWFCSPYNHSVLIQFSVENLK